MAKSMRKVRTGGALAAIEDLERGYGQLSEIVRRAFDQPLPDLQEIPGLARSSFGSTDPSPPPASDSE